MKFYLDEDIASQLLVQLLTKAGHDVLTTFRAGKSAATDSEQLTFAADEQRVVITGNIRDFAVLNKKWQMKKQPHAGIMCILRRRSDRANAERILAYARRFPESSCLPDTLCFP